MQTSARMEALSWALQLVASSSWLCAVLVSGELTAPERVLQLMAACAWTLAGLVLAPAMAPALCQRPAGARQEHKETRVSAAPRDSIELNEAKFSDVYAAIV
jgi:hypothetical protein